MTITKIAGVAVAALVLTTSFALAGGGIRLTDTNAEINPNILQLAKVAGCQVSGTPSEFPDDLWFLNKGAGTLKAGTKIKWSVPFSSDSGVYTLVADLNPGKGVFASGILGGGVEAGHDCKAKVL